MSINPIVIGKGDDLVEVVRELIFEMFYGGLPTIEVDLSYPVINADRANAIARFVDLVRQHRVAMKMSTASKKTGTSINPDWRDQLVATMAWRELLLPTNYGPCAIARLLTGGHYTHTPAAEHTASGRRQKQYAETWDWDIVEAFCQMAIRRSKQLGWDMLYVPNKEPVSESHRDFYNTVMQFAAAEGVEVIDVLKDTFMAQLPSVKRQYFKGNWAALCDNETGDEASDVLQEHNGDFTMCSDVYCLGGELVLEQPGGTNQTMYDSLYMQGKPYPHAYLDTFRMAKLAFCAANPSDKEFVAKQAALYDLVTSVYTQRSDGWDTQSLLEETRQQAEAANLLFA